MKDSIQIFKNPAFGQMRVKSTEKGEALFCLSDVCNVLDIKNPRDCKSRLSQKGVVTTDTLTSGGTQKLLFIDEPNLYRCIFQSRKQEAESFQDWVVEEVLPSIRKNGGYMVSKPEETEEELLARALVLANEAIKRNAKQIEQNERKLAKQAEIIEAKDKQRKKDLPRITFAHAVETSEKSVLIGELAKIIKQNGVEIGQNRLFHWLRENGYLCYKGESYNLPSQKSMNLGLMEVKKTSIVKPDGTTLVTTTPKITGKGQIYFVNRFLYDTINENAKGGNK